MKYKALSNFEINNYFNGKQYFAGCYSKDVLPNKIQLNKFYIFNLDDSTGGGTHWTMCQMDSKHVVYFDPFGVVPAVNILNFMRTSKKPMYYSTLTLQHIKSELCGYYCIYMIEQMISNRNFVDIVSQDFVNDESTNDKYIKKYFKNVHF